MWTESILDFPPCRTNAHVHVLADSTRLDRGKRNCLSAEVLDYGDDDQDRRVWHFWCGGKKLADLRHSSSSTTYRPLRAAAAPRTRPLDSPNVPQRTVGLLGSVCWPPGHFPHSACICILKFIPFSTEIGEVRLVRAAVLLAGRSKLLLVLLLDGGKVSYHVEGRLGDGVTLAGEDGLEGVEGVLQGHKLTGHTFRG